LAYYNHDYTLERNEYELASRTKLILTGERDPCMRFKIWLEIKSDEIFNDCQAIGYVIHGAVIEKKGWKGSVQIALRIE